MLNSKAKGSTMQKVTFNTNGTGYWSNVAKTVEIVDMYVCCIGEDKDFGELRVVFNTDTWDVNADGLVYTDKQFKAEMCAFLDAHGLAGADVDYSEQGMQGDDYVSCDIGAKFIATWEAKFGAVEVDC
jgi:hypothetical protein